MADAILEFRLRPEAGSPSQRARLTLAIYDSLDRHERLWTKGGSPSIESIRLRSTATWARAIVHEKIWGSQEGLDNKPCGYTARTWTKIPWSRFMT